MLRLRPPRPDDEAAFLAGHEQMAAEDFTFGLQLEPDMPWQDYLGRLADSTAGVNLPDGWVGSTFLVADLDEQIIGRVSIRHELNEFLRTRGGHIGYCVLPAYRRRGIGRLLKLRVHAWARTHGFREIHTTTTKADPAMLALNDALGYPIVASWGGYELRLSQ